MWSKSVYRAHKQQYMKWGKCLNMLVITGSTEEDFIRWLIPNVGLIQVYLQDSGQKPNSMNAKFKLYHLKTSLILIFKFSLWDCQVKHNSAPTCSAYIP